MRPRNEQQRHATHLVCRHCGQRLPVSRFERYRTGTYRHICKRCWWTVYGRRLRERYILKQQEGKTLEFGKKCCNFVLAIEMHHVAQREQ